MGVERNLEPENNSSIHLLEPRLLIEVKNHHLTLYKTLDKTRYINSYILVFKKPSNRYELAGRVFDFFLY